MPRQNKNTSSMARQKNASRITTKLVPRTQALVLEEPMLILCIGLMQVSEHKMCGRILKKKYTVNSQPTSSS